MRNCMSRSESDYNKLINRVQEITGTNKHYRVMAADQ